MTAPDAAFRQLLAAVAMGLSLGLVYGFLRPLRRGFSLLPDAVVVLFAFYLALQLGFGVCGGDLRLGYLAGLLGGAFLWEATLGRLLRPIFARFWGFLWWIVGVPWGFLKKILKKLRNFRKKYLHLEKNRVQ